jgi:PAS domain S-box-containing protein
MANGLGREDDTVRGLLAAIVESSDDAIISKTLDGIIMSWNRAAERVFGYTAEEAVGNHITLLRPPEHGEEMARILERIRRGEKVDHFETQRRTKDGRIIDVSLAISPVYGAEGQIVGASKVARDITERKRAEVERQRLLAEAEAARAAAEAASRMKDQFLAILSHEIRTPLTAILGWAKIIRSGKIDEQDQHEGLDAIERNARVLADLVEDLLDIARIVAGTLRLDVQRVNLSEVIRAALATVIPAAEAKGVSIHTVLDSLAGSVSGDPARLQQVVWNLVSNAVKFTPKGGQVQVLLERVNSHVEITVIDTGQGIKPEFLPHVFDRFRQADASTTRQHGGLGLGLSIVKHLVEMHGGTVRAKSPGEGRGATFTVTLPIMVVHPQEGAPEPLGPKAAPTAELESPMDALVGIKVLVVDDEPDGRALLKRVLADRGAEVRVAESVAEALKILEKFRPQVLVSDIGMPDEDGYDLIRQIRVGGWTARRLPAVALTAFARAEDRKRAMLAGFQTHVAKPVDPAELVAVVASLAGRTGGV